MATTTKKATTKKTTKKAAPKKGPAKAGDKAATAAKAAKAPTTAPKARDAARAKDGADAGKPRQSPKAALAQRSKTKAGQAAALADATEAEAPAKPKYSLETAPGKALDHMLKEGRRQALALGFEEECMGPHTMLAMTLDDGSLLLPIDGAGGQGPGWLELMAGKGGAV